MIENDRRKELSLLQTFDVRIKTKIQRTSCISFV
jgi:hypothetical protein